LIIYIEASPEDEAALIERAAADPKPLYYREAFLDEHLANYMSERGLQFATEIDPADFVRWVFPYQYGYAIKARDAFEVSNADEFLTLIGSALDS